MAPLHWEVLAEAEILRIGKEMGIPPSELDRMSIEEILNANEFLDVQADAVEAMERARREQDKIRSSIATAAREFHRR